MPAEASSLIPPALDQLREHPEVAPGEVPGLLGRLAQVPDPRDPRGVRHALVGVLALAARAVAVDGHVIRLCRCRRSANWRTTTSKSSGLTEGNSLRGRAKPYISNRSGR